MVERSSRSAAVGLTISGAVGILIGAGGMLYAQKQADTAENQY